MKQTITLYLDIEPGEKASLATVAKASLAFDAAVREIAYIIDPSLDIRLEIESGTEGSLRINSLLNAAKAKITDRATLAAVALLLAGWFAQDVRTWVTEQLLQTITGQTGESQITEDEAELIAQKVTELLDRRVGQEPVQQIYQELQTDDAITGVGVTPEHDTVPRYVVPRSEFPLRSAPGDILESEPQTKIEERVEVLNLVSPVLLDGQRKWRFSFHQGEFGASILDGDFLDRVLSGREPIPMTAGIRLRVILRTKSQFENGLWALKERTVLRVLAVEPTLRQSSMDLAPPEQGSDSQGEN